LNNQTAQQCHLQAHAAYGTLRKLLSHVIPCAHVTPCWCCAIIPQLLCIIPIDSSIIIIISNLVKLILIIAAAAAASVGLWLAVLLLLAAPAGTPTTPSPATTPAAATTPAGSAATNPATAAIPATPQVRALLLLLLLLLFIRHILLLPLPSLPVAGLGAWAAVAPVLVDGPAIGGLSANICSSSTQVGLSGLAAVVQQRAQGSTGCGYYKDGTSAVVSSTLPDGM
jgi:hypothetical protein